MTNTDFENRQTIIKNLTNKALAEINASDIVDFWGELTGSIITTNYHTGEIKFEDAYDWAVYYSIEAAAEDGINTILEWALDGDEDAVRWLAENGVDIEKDADEIPIESVEPEYTGGNIYIFTGKLTNGNYFVADGDMFDVRIVDAPWDWEESQFPDWQEAHLVEDLSAADALQFCKRMIDWVKTNKPDGNYSMSDMDYIEKDLDDCIKDEQNGVMWR